jgi:hypothetical protein
MKKFVIVILMAMATVGMTFAATTGNLGVNATIDPVLSVALADTALTFSALTGTGDKTSTTTNLTIISNYRHWSVTIASQNASTDKGTLKDTATVEPAASLPYKLSATLVNTGWANAGNITNGISSFTSLATDKSIAVNSASNGKTPVSGAVYTLQAQVTLPSGTTEMYETGKTFSDTIMITIVNNA